VASHRSLRLTEYDRRVLGFAAEHRVVLGRQLERVTGARRPERLRALVDARHLARIDGFAEAHFQIRPSGLAAIDSDLPAPGLSMTSYKHDIGAAWLWLAAHGGAFGPLTQVLSERRLRSHDGTFERPFEPHGVRLGGVDQFGNERLHYPDLVLIDARERRLALELELTRKGRGRRESILGGYGSDPRIDRVLYLVEANRVGRAIGRLTEGTAREMGLAGIVRVQQVKPFGLTRDESRALGPVRRSRRSVKAVASVRAERREAGR
jgi:hypothetical protein